MANWYDAAEHAFEAIVGWVYSTAVDPLVYSFGLMSWAERAFDALVRSRAIRRRRSSTMQDGVTVFVSTRKGAWWRPARRSAACSATRATRS